MALHPVQSRYFIHAATHCTLIVKQRTFLYDLYRAYINYPTQQNAPIKMFC